MQHSQIKNKTNRQKKKKNSFGFLSGLRILERKALLLLQLAKANVGKLLIGIYSRTLIALSFKARLAIAVLTVKNNPLFLNCNMSGQLQLTAGQEATVRTRYRTTDWFQIGKGVCQAFILHSAYLTSMQSTSYKILGWMKHKLESRLPGELSITSDMQMTPPLWQKVKRN